MADVFISCSRLDHERVTPIAARLNSLGYSVWWDQPERARQASIDERERELVAARAVLVMWSAGARDAPQVQAEAAHALDAGKLLQVKLDPVALPPPFNSKPAADMTGAGEWGPLEHALSQMARKGETSAAPERLGVGLAPLLSATGSPKLVTFAAIAALAAYAGALGASVNGAMSPDQLQIALAGVFGVAGACTALCAHRFFAIARAGG